MCFSLLLCNVELFFDYDNLCDVSAQHQRDQNTYRVFLSSLYEFKLLYSERTPCIRFLINIDFLLFSFENSNKWFNTFIPFLLGLKFLCLIKDGVNILLFLKREKRVLLNYKIWILIRTMYHNFFNAKFLLFA